MATKCKIAPQIVRDCMRCRRLTSGASTCCLCAAMASSSFFLLCARHSQHTASCKNMHPRPAVHRSSLDSEECEWRTLSLDISDSSSLGTAMLLDQVLRPESRMRDSAATCMCARAPCLRTLRTRRSPAEPLKCGLPALKIGQSTPALWNDKHLRQTTCGSDNPAINM